MTREKLKKEAEEYADEKCKDCYMCSYSECKNPYKICQRRKDRKQAYLASAEPREKQIQIDAEQIRVLQKQNGELTDRVKELESQIEKMKCCENCGWYYLQQHWRESEEINESRMFHCGTCGNKRNWKLREIKEK